MFWNPSPGREGLALLPVSVDKDDAAAWFPV